MKNIFKKLILIFALLIPCNVFATDYIPGTLLSLGHNDSKLYYSSTSNAGPSSYYRGSKGDYYVYHYPSYTYNIQLNDGRKYAAVCVDPGLNAPSVKSLKCVAIKNDKIEKLLKDNQDVAGSVNDYHASLEMAVRANALDYSSSWVEGRALIPIYTYLTERYEGKSGSQLDLTRTMFEIDGSNSQTADTYKHANANHTSGDVLDKAFEYYSSVAELSSSDTDDDSDSDVTAAGITISDPTKVDNVYTYTVYSTKELKDVEFVCDSNCTIISSTWTAGAKNGTVQVRYDGSSDCKFRFTMYYNLYSQTNLTTSHLYLCSYGDDITSNTNTYQKYAVYMDEEKQVEEKFSFSYTATPDECICNSNAEVKKSISQCCDIEQDSYIYEPKITELFCEEKTDSLDVDGYKPSSKAEDDYKVSNSVSGISLENSYCELYCSERIDISLPGTVKANNGKYFTITNNLYPDSDGPYFKGKKTCRLRIDYSSWYSDYKTKTEAARDAFNNYQKAQAKKDMYTKVYNDKLASLNSTSNTGSKTRTVSFSGTASTSCVKDSDGSTVTINDISVSDSATPSCDFKYRYYVSKSDYPATKFKQVKISYNNSDTLQEFSGLSIEYTTEGTFGDEDKLEGYYDINGWVSSTCGYTNLSTSSSCSGTYTDCNGETKTLSNQTCSYSGISGDLPTDIKTSFNNEKDSTNPTTQASSYSSAVGSINNLESYLNECDNYFDEGGKGTERDTTLDGSPYKVYNMTPSTDFNYFTVSINNTNSRTQSVERNIPFSVNCTYSFTKVGETADADATSLGLEGYHYNKFNGDHTASIKNFNNSVITCLNNQCNSSYNTTTLDSTGLLDASSIDYSQRYTEDGYYTAECNSINDQSNSVVVYPYGDFIVNNTKLLDSDIWTEYNTNKKLWILHSTSTYVEYSSMNGTYETYWNFSNVGSDGRFDTYLKNNQTCSESANNSGDSRLYCTLKVNNELTYSKGCDTGIVLSLNQQSPGYWDDNCERTITDSDVLSYTFKIVDSSNFFTDTDWQDKYAYNWKQNIDVMNAIESVAAADKEYSDERLTYAFILTSSDLTTIKNYNSSTSYSDFNMTCTPVVDSENHIVKYKDCRSEFITNYYDGKVCTSSSCKNIKQKVDSSYPTLSSIRDSSIYRHVEG